MPPVFSNRLIRETSPYLLQHAHNPVDWYPWGSEALQKAKEENKVILVSIGYSACHWCHVMEKESFENDAVAALMNAHFINIKIDREERPDLDHIYMDAVQAMTGSGGWPLNVFLTPDTKPFYGGTYFPPVKAFNRSSWTDVLNAIQKAWTERPDEIKEQADKLTGHLLRSNNFGFAAQNTGNINADLHFTKENSDTVFQEIMKNADREWGGFGKAPKFPQTFTIQYLLQYHHFTRNEEALEQALLSIDKMLEGGIFDQLGGGLARYSTDNEWLAPHFEKMLYDNALLVGVLCDAYQLTGFARYEKAIRETIGFVIRELMHPDGGFYSALDADSEGEEGRYYVWQKKEVDDLLGADADWFCAFFDITDKGNWEGKNILRMLEKADSFCQRKGLDPGEFNLKTAACKQILFKARNKRIRPSLDDKILLGWNALMITALCKASAALKDKEYKTLAEKSLLFILDHFGSGNGTTDYFHTYKNNIAKYPAFLDDYAFLVQACIQVQELTSDVKYLQQARDITDHVIRQFGDAEAGLFFYTRKDQDDVIVRKKEVHDGAIPSGNSIMAYNLFYLSLIFNNSDWSRIAQEITSSISKAVIRYPGSFGIWANIMLKFLYGFNEIAITGGNAETFRDEVLRHYIPNKIIQCSSLPNNDFPLLTGKNFDFPALIYLCRNYACKAPVKTIRELIKMIENTI